ncbi:nucleoside-diphosphate sugar epimerase/dehydratase [Yoonia sp. SS1-5]|uniref:Nucleoside-diphosphate sugar epimerase/dehydratase n=1 Tax=Yoonia rhodophyticola TaxID=3137370 RepID=A0AAN0MBM1_9RHOB
MPRARKRLVFLATDTCLVLVSLYLAVILRFGYLMPLSYFATFGVLFPIMAVVAPFVVSALGIQRVKLHAIENDAVLRIALAAALLTFSAIAVVFLLDLPTPRSVPLIFGAVFFVASVTVRVVGLRVLQLFNDGAQDRLPVIIYGAGAAGIQLASALRQSVETRPVLFVDDNPNLHNVMIAGLNVYSPAQLSSLIPKYNVARVLLAIPSLDEKRREAVIKTLGDLPVEIQVLPSFIELMAGRGLETSLRSVSPDELLGRDKVDLEIPEIAKAYAGRVVMVTGAGGSIGSELCRQLINCSPARIVLFEQSEYALYAIDQDLTPRIKGRNISVVPRLGSVTNKQRVTDVVVEEGVEIILHAAAYKHVPLVEENEIEGATNNVIGTKTVADVADAQGIERFILVSTDKAVRPTNIMGATKRMAELVVQDVQTRAARTKYAMVRFGNVLGSSGSVLPLFARQIEQGGPVTVTHPDVTRFFMTIPEAARLVLLAGAYAEGGDVFVLDMGKPQRIIDIAHRMIQLSGRTVKDPDSGLGDIEIEITGLRPGEKLYEELLVDDTLSKTPHPKILRAEEMPLSEIAVASMLKNTQVAISAGDRAALRRVIADRVDGYHQQDLETIRA